MYRAQWAGLLPALFFWTLMTPPTSAQALGSGGGSIQIRGMVQSEPGPGLITLEVKNQRVYFVYHEGRSDSEQALLSQLVTDVVGRTPGMEVKGPEEMLKVLLQEQPSQRRLELRGDYDPDLRVFYLSGLQPLDMYPPAQGCPPLPGKGPANQVSIYVAQAQDKPGFVCARAINGLSTSVTTGGPLFILQKWEKGEFREPGGSVAAYTLAAIGMLPGQAFDRRLPLFEQPAPPGRYRVCFTYLPPEQRESQHVCSAEFSLP